MCDLCKFKRIQVKFFPRVSFSPFGSNVKYRSDLVQGFRGFATLRVACIASILYFSVGPLALSLLTPSIPSIQVQMIFNWKTAVAVLLAAACQVTVDPTLAMVAKLLRDTARSRLGTLAYQSPLGDWFKLAEPTLETQPVPQPWLVQATRTSKAGDQFKILEALKLEIRSLPPDVPHVLLDPSKGYQTFLGFGGSFTESSADLFQQMSPDMQETVLQAYFSRDKGLAYNWGRLHMGSCDFSKGNWSCVAEGDEKLETFSIKRYHNTILPFLRRAQKAAGDIKLLASPWSPPAWMKDNQQMLNGGTLLPRFRSSWAKHFVLFAEAFESEGLPLWGFTVQNEPRAVTPWENCLYTADEERDFVRDHLGPALAASTSSHLKLLIWDHNRDNMFLRAHTIYSDPEAAKYVWGIGYHWYGDTRYEFWPAREGMLLFDNVRKVHELWPDKHIIMTESCQESGPRIGDWKLGERYAEAIIQDLENWLEAWIDWNLILDETGGPNHVQNLVSAPVIYDRARKKLVFLSSFYYIGHFSRYIVPGAQRIAVASNRDKLKATGFRNPDGTLVAVLLNQEDYDIRFWLNVNGRSAETELPARSITTYRFHHDNVNPE